MINLSKFSKEEISKNALSVIKGGAGERPPVPEKLQPIIPNPIIIVDTTTPKLPI